MIIEMLSFFLIQIRPRQIEMLLKESAHPLSNCSSLDGQTKKKKKSFRLQLACATHKLKYLVENSFKIFSGHNLVRLLSGMKTIPKHIIMSIRTYVSSVIVTQHSNFNQSGSTSPSINHLKSCHIYHDKHTVLLFFGLKQRG